MQKAPDDVSNIHNRFSLTLINPSSHYFSLIASLIVAIAITVTTYLGYLDSEDFWIRIPLVVGVLAITQLIDTRFTKKKEYSKSLHASLFANLLWVATLLMGLLASFVLSKETSLFFVTFGFDLSWDSTIDFENLCTLIICFGISSHFVLQVLHIYFISDS